MPGGKTDRLSQTFGRIEVLKQQCAVLAVRGGPGFHRPASCDPLPSGDHAVDENQVGICQQRGSGRFRRPRGGNAAVSQTGAGAAGSDVRSYAVFEYRMIGLLLKLHFGEQIERFFPNDETASALTDRAVRFVNIQPSTCVIRIAVDHGKHIIHAVVDAFVIPSRIFVTVGFDIGVEYIAALSDRPRELELEDASIACDGKMPDRANRIELRMQLLVFLSFLVRADQRPVPITLGTRCEQDLEFGRQIIGPRGLPDFLCCAGGGGGESQ